MSPKFAIVVVVVAAASIALWDVDAPGQSSTQSPSLQGPATPVPLESERAADRRNPTPLPIIDKCTCTASVFERLANGGLVQRQAVHSVTDTASRGVPPR